MDKELLSELITMFKEELKAELEPIKADIKEIKADVKGFKEKFTDFEGKEVINKLTNVTKTNCYEIANLKHLNRNM